MRVAPCTPQVPNAVTERDFNDLERYYSDMKVVDIVAVIALSGFLNWINDRWPTSSNRHRSKREGAFLHGRAGGSASTPTDRGLPSLPEQLHRTRLAS